MRCSIIVAVLLTCSVVLARPGNRRHNRPNAQANDDTDATSQVDAATGSQVPELPQGPPMPVDPQDVNGPSGANDPMSMPPGFGPNGPMNMPPAFENGPNGPMILPPGFGPNGPNGPMNMPPGFMPGQNSPFDGPSGPNGPFNGPPPGFMPGQNSPFDGPSGPNGPFNGPPGFMGEQQGPMGGAPEDGQMMGPPSLNMLMGIISQLPEEQRERAEELLTSIREIRGVVQDAFEQMSELGEELRTLIHDAMSARSDEDVEAPADVPTSDDGAASNGEGVDVADITEDSDADTADDEEDTNLGTDVAGGDEDGGAVSNDAVQASDDVDDAIDATIEGDANNE